MKGLNKKTTMAIIRKKKSKFLLENMFYIKKYSIKYFS